MIGLVEVLDHLFGFELLVVASAVAATSGLLPATAPLASWGCLGFCWLSRRSCPCLLPFKMSSRSRLLRLGAKAELGKRRDLLVGGAELGLELGDTPLEYADAPLVCDGLALPRRLLLECSLLLLAEVSCPGARAPKTSKELLSIELVVGLRHHDDKHTRYVRLCSASPDALTWAYGITERLHFDKPSGGRLPC
jgi:hypothetical protein